MIAEMSHAALERRFTKLSKKIGWNRARRQQLIREVLGVQKTATHMTNQELEKLISIVEGLKRS